MDIAAIISNGGALPFQSIYSNMCSVIIYSTEDDIETTRDLDAIDQIRQMTDKDALNQYAMQHFNQKLAKNQSVEKMQEKVINLISPCPPDSSEGRLRTFRRFYQGHILSMLRGIRGTDITTVI